MLKLKLQFEAVEAMVHALFAFPNYPNIHCYQAGEDFSQQQRNKMMGTCVVVTVLPVLGRGRKYVNNNRNHTKKRVWVKVHCRKKKVFLFICTGSANLLLQVVFSYEEVEYKKLICFSHDTAKYTT